MPLYEDYVEDGFEDEDVGSERLHLLDSEMISVITSWQFVNRVIDAGSDKDDPWELVSYDIKQWMKLANIPAMNTRRFPEIVERVQILHFIHPDGGMPDDVKNLLQVTAFGERGVRVAAKVRPKE